MTAISDKLKYLEKELEVYSSEWCIYYKKYSTGLDNLVSYDQIALSNFPTIILQTNMLFYQKIIQNHLKNSEIFVDKNWHESVSGLLIETRWF